MTTVQNQVFENQTVEVDGHRFETCIFKHCRLVYQGGELPVFVRCEFEEGVSIQLKDGALRTIDYLSALHSGGFSRQVEDALSIIERGEKPVPSYIKQYDAEAVGANFGQLALINGGMILATIGIVAAIFYGFVEYPKNEILENNRPLSQEVPLELYPALPQELADAYDASYAEQLNTLSSYSWVDQENGIAAITIEEAMQLIAADDTLSEATTEGDE